MAAVVGGQPALARWRLGYSPQLDGLRGVAVLLVIGNHVGLPGFTHAGQVGVTAFFVLSGFLITSIILQEREDSGRVDLARFYWHRALRLFPALLGMLAFAGPLILLAVPEPGIAALVPAALYFSNWVQVAGVGDVPVVGHTWSLAVEEQFYLIWPLVVIGLAGLARSWMMSAGVLVGGAVLVAIERALLWEPTREGFYRVFYSSDARADALLLGSAMAFVHLVRPVSPTRWTVSAAAGVAIVTVVMPPVGFLATVGIGAAALASSVLVAGAAMGRVALLASRPVVWVGVISYALYLWHVPMLFLTETLLGEIPLAPVAGIAGTFAAAWGSRRWIEQPARRWRDRVPGRQASGRGSMAHG